VLVSESRPPFPPFSRETALKKVQAAEDAWNTRDPHRVALAYTPDSAWRNRDQFLAGREQIADNGLMQRREASINDIPIEESQRRLFGPRPENERREGHDIPLQ
jgi:uncharacterized protein (TIGR02246 family)